MNWFAMLYAAAWATRLFGVRHVLRAPRFYGPDWCCDCRVVAGFYRNEGRALMRSLQIRVLMPLVVEAAIGVWLGSQGRWLMALAVEGAAITAAYLYHVSLLRGVARQAWPYAVPVSDPVSSVAVSLRPRTLADYTLPWLEWTFGGAAGAVLFLLGLTLARQHGRVDLASLIWPGLALYAALGLTLGKRAIVAWRVFGAPAVNPEQFAEVQNAARGHLIRVCDCLLSLVLTVALGWAVLQAWPDLWALRRYVLLYPLIAVALAWLAPLVRSERRLKALGRELRAPLDRYRPSSPPSQRPEGAFYLGGRLCFRRGEPAVFVCGPRGLALNGSSAGTRAWLTYVTGWIVTIVAIAARK